MSEVFSYQPRNLSCLVKYTVPDQETCAEQHELLKMIPPLYFDHSLVIGRFQPLHYGHLYLMKWATKLAGNFTIGIGSANIVNQDNPFSIQERTTMLLKALSQEGLIGKLCNIVPLWDFEDDTLWIEQTLNRVGKTDVVLGNNPWVNSVFQNHGIPAIEIPLLNRGKWQGSIIREQLRQNNYFKPSTISL